MTRAQTQQVLRQLPAKWALSILAIIVLYAFVQPALNNRLGWNLPSLAGMMGEKEPAKKVAEKDKPSKSGKSATANKPDDTEPIEESDTEQSSASEQTSRVDEPPAAKSKSAKPVDQPATKTTSKPATKTTSSTASKPATSKPAASSTAKPADKTTSNDLRYGILKDTGRERYVSVEGLQYNPGSAEGHRLKHLERHLDDIPDRPGKHGVFDGDMSVALKVIDDAYARGKSGAKGVRTQEEDGRTVYEVTFDKPIGYIGGSDGARAKNPPAKRLRLVVEGNRFITGFPF